LPTDEKLDLTTMMEADVEALIHATESEGVEEEVEN
jgi:hypothetical protein